jgi:type IV pilus assembly protein PilA
MKRRPGFTLVELVIVIVVLGLLAAIAVSRFWTVKDRTYRTSVKNDLRTVTVQQERYFAKNMQYAADVNDLPDIQLSPGVTINIVWTDPAGWAATGQHPSLAPQLCGYFTGPAPAGIAAPATQSGSIVCDE